MNIIYKYERNKKVAEAYASPAYLRPCQKKNLKKIKFFSETPKGTTRKLPTEKLHDIE